MSRTETRLTPWMPGYWVAHAIMKVHFEDIESDLLIRCLGIANGAIVKAKRK